VFYHSSLSSFGTVQSTLGVGGCGREIFASASCQLQLASHGPDLGVLQAKTFGLLKEKRKGSLSSGSPSRPFAIRDEQEGEGPL
jgi:hypothetical protein